MKKKEFITRAAVMLLVMMLTATTATAAVINVASTTDLGTKTAGSDATYSDYYLLADGNTYRLTADVNLDGYLRMENATVTIDLNGHKLNRGLTESTKTYNGCVIMARTSTLTICDSGSGGTITGGYSKDGAGGLYVNMNSTVTMTSGTISGNYADKNVGGVYIHYTSTFNMTGGTVTNNTSGSNGKCGGVYIMHSSKQNKYGTFNVSGSARVTANKLGSTTSNVYLPSGGTFNVTGALTGYASVGVTMEDGTGTFAQGSGSPAYSITESDLTHFKSDISSHYVWYQPDSDGKAYLTDDDPTLYYKLTWNATGGYFEIRDEQDLIDLGDFTASNAANTCEGLTFKLTADLDFTNMPTRKVNGNSGNFHPIGLVEDESFDGIFSGHFDGQNHTIKALRYTNKLESGTNNNEPIGLFKKVDGSGAVVERVVLIDPQMSGTSSGCGGIAGLIRATIRNCTVLGGTITRTGTGKSGGIVGSYSSNAATIEGCTVIGTSVQDGMIIGYGNSQQTIKDCIYYDPNGIGIAGNTYTDGGGNQRVYQLTLGDDVTTSTAATYSSALLPSKAYYTSGATVTLGHAIRTGYAFGSYESSNVTITDGAFTMPAADVAVAATFTPDPAHFSQSGDEYTIHTAAGWNVFCDCLNDNDTYNRFSGKTVRLGADIGSAENPVTRMAGGSGHEFTGTFDGGGKTLTVNYTNNNDVMTAPFSYVNGATIQNLIVGGTISGSHNRAAGIVGETTGQTTITNCVSSVDISSERYTGGISIGGLVTITGCVFNGKIVGTDRSGGFVGYSNTATAISNSLFAPQDDSNISGGTFYYNGGGDITPTNSYYTRALGTPQGKATRTVTADADVTIEAVALTGTATQYTVSGITAYSGGGLQRGQTLYYGSGDQLSLTLSNTATGAPLGYQYGYTASAGTLSGQTLTMPDEDVTISVNTAALAPIDWATVNQGDSEDPYMIYNKDQLLLLAHRVNGTNGETANDYSGKYFKLGADITFDHPAAEPDDYAENYEAIGGYLGGYTYRHFRGNFNGDNKTVSGIRIRKTGDGDADSYQGLFGMISGGTTIHDVHLTDARIKSYYYVGGIVGYNNSCTVSGCTVTDSYITATKEPTNNYGTICGYKSSSGTLTNNYYHGCTVNGTAVTSGKGCQGADITAINGALPAYRLALGANITTPPGTFAGQTEWLDTPPVSPRLAPGNGFTLAGNHYFASGYEFTPGSTLASGAAQGYTPRATLGDELLDLYTPTGDTDLLAGKAIARLTITADCDGKTLASTQAIYSTGQPVTVAYINDDGTADEASAIALDGTETSLAAGTYFAGLPTVQFDHELTLTGDVTLILADNCHMNVGTSGEGRINGYGITLSGDATLDITSEANGNGNGNGALSIYTKGMVNHGINVDALTINGGHVTADVNGDYAVALNAGHGAVTINGGTLSATATGSYADAIYASGNVNYNGGTVTATAPNGNAIYAADGNYIFSWRTPADRITIGATGLYAPDNKTATFARLFTDATDPDAIDPADNYYGGTYTGDALNALAGKTLSGTEEVTLTEDNATQALAAINGMSGIGVTFNRAFTASKPSTICLPFDYTKKEGDGSFYAFTSIEHSGGEYIATMTEPGTTTLTANTPYLYLPSATGNVEFSGTPTTAIAAGTTTSGDWTFQGTYDEVKWDTAPTGIYGFSAQNVSDQGISQGEFVKVGAKVRIRPLRAYLKYKNGTENYSAAPTRGTTAELPDRIIVRLIGSDSNTTAIGTLDTRTGEVEIDTWYDLNGRKLSAKPTHRGIYINNGRKVVIK